MLTRRVIEFSLASDIWRNVRDMIAARNPEPRGRSSTRAAPPPARNPAGIAAAPVWLLKIRRAPKRFTRIPGKSFLTGDAVLLDCEIRIANSNFNHKCTGISYQQPVRV